MADQILINDPYAGFIKRLKAFGFDYLLIVGYIILLAAGTMAVIKISGFFGLSLRWPENPLLADLMAFVTLVLPVILYFTLQESSPKQATWGKTQSGYPGGQCQWRHADPEASLCTLASQNDFPGKSAIPAFSTFRAGQWR